MCLADKVFTIAIACPAVSPTASIALLSFWTFYLQSCQVYLQNRSHFSAHHSSSTAPAKQPSSPTWILASYQTLCTVLTPSDCAFQQPEGSFNIEVRLGLILLWTIKWLIITAKVKSKVPTVAKVAHGTWPCLLLPCTPSPATPASCSSVSWSKSFALAGRSRGLLSPWEAALHS